MSLKTKKEGCDASFFFIGFTDSELVQSKFLGVRGASFKKAPRGDPRGGVFWSFLPLSPQKSEKRLPYLAKYGILFVTNHPKE
jgi:hypothetical protein